MTKEAPKARKAGADFLTSNGKKEGVKTTASGLQYQVTKEGEGKAPQLTDVVKVHYTGTLLNGDVFDFDAPATPRRASDASGSRQQHGEAGAAEGGVLDADVAAAA